MSKVPEAIQALINSLPPAGEWDEYEKRRWFEAFTKNFEFFYPNELVNR